MENSGPSAKDLSPAQRLDLIRRGEAILRGKKGDPRLHQQLGLLYSEDGQMGPALHHFGIAAKKLKKDPVIMGSLAEIHVKLQDFQSAKKYVRKMVELQPRNEGILIYQAEFLEKAGQTQQALEVWKKINRLFPGNADNLGDLANCYQSLGEWTEAEVVFNEALAINPLHPLALYRIANSRKFSREEALEMLPRVVEATKKAISNGSDHYDISNLYYTAGKLNTEIGDLDAAMDDFQKANQQSKSEPDESPEKLFFENTPLVFSKDFIRSESRYGNKTDAPIFILGMPRSGTTLVESLLGGHSLITAGDELNFIGPISDRMGLRRSKAASIKMVLDTWKPEDIEKLADEYLGATKELRADTPHFTDKLPHNFMHIGLIKILFPNAHIIHCRRHPIDNCLSLYTNSMSDFHHAYKHDLKTLGLYYQRYLALMEHWRQSVPGGFHEVFYEDVVANTELNARAMINYLGLEWEDGVMAREGSQTAVKTLSKWQVRQPIYTSSAGRWKKFEKHLGPLIDALGSSVSAYENALSDLNKGSSK